MSAPGTPPGPQPAPLPAPTPGNPPNPAPGNPPGTPPTPPPASGFKDWLRNNGILSVAIVVVLLVILPLIVWSCASTGSKDEVDVPKNKQSTTPGHTAESEEIQRLKKELEKSRAQALAATIAATNNPTVTLPPTNSPSASVAKAVALLGSIGTNRLASTITPMGASLDGNLIEGNDRSIIGNNNVAFIITEGGSGQQNIPQTPRVVRVPTDVKMPPVCTMWQWKETLRPCETVTFELSRGWTFRNDTETPASDLVVFIRKLDGQWTEYYGYIGSLAPGQPVYYTSIRYRLKPGVNEDCVLNITVHKNIP